MKYIAVLFASVAIVGSCFGQGTIEFNNRKTTAGVDAPIYNVDGVTPLAGPTYRAMLYAGAPTSDANTLSAVGGSLGFRVGTGEGYFLTTGEDTTRTINAVAPGAQATLQVRVWDSTTGATWETATVRGASSLFTVTTGGGGSPAGLPAAMVGLTSFQLVPEPSTYALGMIGLGALFFVRRRK